jgi:hypothetical protein
MNLEDIENELRKLQPTEITYCPPKRVPKRRLKQRLWLAIPVAAAASLLLVVLFNLPKMQSDEVVVQKVEPMREVFTPHFATVRELYADIAKDLPVVQVSPGEYKIIELTVAESRAVPVPMKHRRLRDWSADFDL